MSKSNPRHRARGRTHQKAPPRHIYNPAPPILCFQPVLISPAGQIAVKGGASTAGAYANLSKLPLKDVGDAPFQSLLAAGASNFVHTGGASTEAASKNAVALAGGGELIRSLINETLCSKGELLTRATLVSDPALVAA